MGVILDDDRYILFSILRREWDFAEDESTSRAVL